MIQLECSYIHAFKSVFGNRCSIIDWPTGRELCRSYHQCQFSIFNASSGTALGWQSKAGGWGSSDLEIFSGSVQGHRQNTCLLCWRSQSQLESSFICYRQYINDSSKFSKASFQSSSQLNMSSQSQYIIPDLLLTWPWKRVLNANLTEVRDEAISWVQSLDLFEPDQLRKFNACDFSTWYLLSIPFCNWSIFLRSSGCASCPATRKRSVPIFSKYYTY